MKITRRSAIGILATTAVVEQQVEAQAPANSATLNWLDGAPPAQPVGVSWGVPWPRGAVRRDQTFMLTANNQPLPLQSWPLAYWPDGSIKFTGFATVTNAPGPYRLAPGAPNGGAPLKLTQSAQSVEIDTGKFIARITLAGASVIDTITTGDRIVARDGRLLCTLDGGGEFVSEIQKVIVEQSGPVRAVVKLEGIHKSPAREWLPFIVRLYF